MTDEKRIQDALSELLDALGFEAMARDVKTEDDLSRLRTYARIIVKQSPPAMQRDIANRFRLLSLHCTEFSSDRHASGRIYNHAGGGEMTVTRKMAFNCVCEKCGHGWAAISKPKRCAKCGTTAWNGFQKRGRPAKNGGNNGSLSQTR